MSRVEGLFSKFLSGGLATIAKEVEVLQQLSHQHWINIHMINIQGFDGP